jgi:hypothetical protein
LTGVVTPGPRVSSMLGHWVLYCDGLPQGEEAGAVEPEVERDA